MASTVKFGRFKWNRAGYAELMDTGGVQSLVEKPAQRVLSAAQGMGGGAYAAKQVQGRLAKGYIVGTGDEESMYDNERHNTLLKAFGGA